MCSTEDIYRHRVAASEAFEFRTGGPERRGRKTPPSLRNPLACPASAFFLASIDAHVCRNSRTPPTSRLVRRGK